MPIRFVVLLFQPTRESFRRFVRSLTRSPEIQLERAFLVAFITIFLGRLLFFYSPMIVPPLFEGVHPVLRFAVLLVGVGLGTMGYFISVWSTDLVARWLGGMRAFSLLAFALLAPRIFELLMEIIEALFDPFNPAFRPALAPLNIIFLVLSTYGTVLLIQAVRSTYDFSISRAIVTLVVSGIFKFGYGLINLFLFETLKAYLGLANIGWFNVLGG